LDWKLLCFYAGAIIGLGLIAGLIIDLKIAKINFWPITKASFLGIFSLTFWHVFYVLTLAVLIITLISEAEFSISTWLGLIMFIAGFSFTLWAVVVLNFKETMGVKGEFCSRGPYRVCRNPQSTGIIVQFLGAILMTYSGYVTILTILHITVLLLLIFAEEPWLAEHYGKEYEEYKKEVPYRLIPYIF